MTCHPSSQRRNAATDGAAFPFPEPPSPPPGADIFPAQAWNLIGERLGLSDRMLEIVREVFDDKTESVIARDLGISDHTIHTHLERIRHKLGVTNRVQLILRVTEEFLHLQSAARPPRGFSETPPVGTRARVPHPFLAAHGSDRRPGVEA